MRSLMESCGAVCTMTLKLDVITCRGLRPSGLGRTRTGVWCPWTGLLCSEAPIPDSNLLQCIIKIKATLPPHL